MASVYVVKKEPEFEGHLALVSLEGSARWSVHVVRLGSMHPSLKGLWLWHGSSQQSE
jgi:hypothetical protein